MKELKSILEHYIYPTCLIFTVLCFVFAVIAYSVDTEYDIPVIELKGISLILLFSALFAASNRIFALKKSPLMAKVLMHFAAYLVNVIVVLMLFGGYFNTGSSALILIVIFSLLYVIIAAPIIILYKVYTRDSEKNKSYKRQF